VVGQNGQHFLVPIVDLGPLDTSDARGVVADFTQGLTNLTGNTGDQNFGFKIIPNAGPDVMKNPQAFADEQAEDNQAYQERFKEYRESLKAYQDNLKNIVPGVSTGTVNNFLANLKSQFTGLIKQKEPDLTDDQAWSKAMTDPNALDVGADFWNKFAGSFQQLGPLLQQATGVGAEQSHVNSFLAKLCRTAATPINTRF
jgi:hypothetical protein